MIIGEEKYLLSHPEITYQINKIKIKMKKITPFLVFSALTLSGFAQRSTAPGKKITSMPLYKSSPSTMMVADTLWGIFGPNLSANAAQEVKSTNGGWISGHNGYGDVSKAQGFLVTNPYTVIGAIYWFAGKTVTSGNANSKVVAKMWDMQGTAGTNTVTTSGTGPGPGLTVGTNVNILFSSIDTSSTGAQGLVVVTFPTPYNATADYAMGLDLTPTPPGDSLGLMVSDPDIALPAVQDMSFDEFSGGGGWHSYLQKPGNWGIDCDLAIFPIINTNSAVEELFFINGIKLYQNYPNPSNGVTTVSFELEQNAKNVKLIIHDAVGKLVKIMDLGSQSAGKHDIALDANTLAQETYYFSIQADRSRLAQKMSIVK